MTTDQGITSNKGFFSLSTGQALAPVGKWKYNIEALSDSDLISKFTLGNNKSESEREDDSLQDDTENEEIK